MIELEIKWQLGNTHTKKRMEKIEPLAQQEEKKRSQLQVVIEQSSRVYFSIIDWPKMKC